jgi:Tfp pilus assembly protein PilX
MVRIFFGTIGSYAYQLIDLYMQHQLVLNLVVVIYGLVVAVAHVNLKRIEALLSERAGSQDVPAAAAAFARGELQLEMSEVREAAILPFIASPFFFGVHRLSGENIEMVIRKKYRRAYRRRRTSAPE